MKNNKVIHEYDIKNFGRVTSFVFYNGVVVAASDKNEVRAHNSFIIKNVRENEFLSFIENVGYLIEHKDEAAVDNLNYCVNEDTVFKSDEARREALHSEYAGCKYLGRLNGVSTYGQYKGKDNFFRIHIVSADNPKAVESFNPVSFYDRNDGNPIVLRKVL